MLASIKRCILVIMNQGGLASILIVLLIAVLFVVFSFFFLTSPHKVAGDPIAPFKNGEYLLSEKITYLFREPQVGDRVIFFPTTQGINYLGIITKVNEDQDVRTYNLVSGAKGTTWTISPEKINSRIYYPFVSEEEIADVLSSETPNWKTYTNSDWQVSFSYPTAWDIELSAANPDLGYPTYIEFKINAAVPYIGFSYIDNSKQLTLEQIDLENTKKYQERGTGIDTPSVAPINYTILITQNGYNAYYEKVYYI